MKRRYLILNLCIVFLIFFVTLQINSAAQDNRKKEAEVNTILIGNLKESSLEQALKNPDVFFDIYNKARERKNAGDYDAAIHLYNEAIKQAKFGAGLGMAYEKLHEIYRAKGDLESELKYIELDIKYSMNEDLNKEHQKRATEIRQLLASKAQSSQT